MKVSFFGHRDASDALKPQLKTAIETLIKEGCDYFYVGNQGAFDYLVLCVLRELKKEHPQIRYAVVLAYLNRPNEQLAEEETIFLDGLEEVPIRFAIDRRNRWMVRQSDIVITCVRAPFGGAAKFKELAEKQGKRVINLVDM